MLIKSLKLNDYRNYNKYSTTFDPHLNIVIGKNGTGKTNLLESILVVSNAKSFRTLNDQDLIQKGKEYLKIDLDSDLNNHKVIINQNNKSLYINDNLAKKTSDYIGKMNAILFKPSDLEIFTEPPNERRKILDLEIGKINKNYLRSVLSYNSLLKDKNKLLKEIEIDKNLLSIIEESMIPHIKTIINEREEFINNINEHISVYYNEISGQQNTIKINYKKCSEINEIKTNLINAKTKDELYKYSTFGPHREDFNFTISGYDANSVASQGQKRMIVIAFKFSLIKYIKEKANTIPILLLDDILSELDKDNQERLIKSLPKDVQVIITNTNINNINIDQEYKLIEIKEN